MERPDTFARIWAVAVADHGDRPFLVFENPGAVHVKEAASR